MNDFKETRPNTLGSLIHGTILISPAYEIPLALMHDPATTSFPHHLAKGTQSLRMVHDIEANES